MLLNVPYLGFFISLIWLILIIVLSFWALLVIRRAMVKTEEVALRAVEFFMALTDMAAVVLWMYLIVRMIAFVLFDVTFTEMFTLVFNTILPLYIVLIAVKFAIYNLANKAIEVDYDA